MESDLIRLRKGLHQFPEISGEEEKTAGRIKRELEKHTPDVIHTGLGGHGNRTTEKQNN